ncbi:sulfur oxidation c-type cytochrome SoxA [Siccirubricoccus deserti]
MPRAAPGRRAAADRKPRGAGARRLCGEPVARPAAGARPRSAARPGAATGEALFRERRGQLNLSCAQCHDDNAGRRLAGSAIPEGHANGYPLYRLEWQGLGSLRRRLRSCMVGVRSEPFPPDAPEYLALEAYLAMRARGLVVETPAIRP